MFQWFMEAFGRGTAETVFFGLFLLALVFTVGGLLIGGHDHDSDHAGGGDHDGDHHGGDDGHQISLSSFFSVGAIALFVIGVGGVGYLVMHYQHGLVLASVSGVVAGLVMAAIGVLIIHITMNQQSNSAVTQTEILGKEVQVVVAIPPGLSGRGQVVVQTAGAPIYEAAMTEDEAGFRPGSAVRVLRSAGDYVVVGRVQA